MRILKKHKQAKKINDVFFDPSRSILSLREKSWKVQVDLSSFKFFFRPSLKRFLKLGSMALLLVVSLIMGRFLVARSSVELFFPQNCLGGWVNPQNAAGEPDLPLDASNEDFNHGNSAVLEN